DNLNALPPQRDNQLNPVKHRNRNVLPQPPEHSPDSIKHGLNDRQHVSLEPRNNSLNRKHDPRPDDLNNVPQPLSTSNNAVPNSLHHRPHVSLEPGNHGLCRNLDASPSRINHVTEP